MSADTSRGAAETEPAPVQASTARAAAEDDASTLFDSPLFVDTFGNDAMRRTFGARNVVRKWLDVERALAAAQGELGIIPAEAADSISRHSRAEHFDLRAIGSEIRGTAHPLVPVIRRLAELCGERYGEYVHYGVTTQDIIDTGTVLLIRDALADTAELVHRIRMCLVLLAEKYRTVAMAGRTHGQHALPITLGFKFAVLADEFARHEDRLAEVAPRALALQLGGAVGSLASLGGRGLDVQEAVAARLGLSVPTIAWHTARDRIAEVVGVIAMIAASVGKIANEVIALQRTEIGEVEEPNPLGKVGSSTMPNKRNPMVAENIVAICRLTAQAVPLALGCMVQDHERDMTSWGVEWAIVPETFIAGASALQRCTEILDGLTVNTDALARNLDMTGGMMMSEAFMMRVGVTIGKQRAHDLLYTATMRAHDDRRPMAEVIAGIPEVARILSSGEIAELLDPLSYLGHCAEFVDRVVADARTDRTDRTDARTGDSDNAGDTNGAAR